MSASRAVAPRATRSWRGVAAVGVAVMALSRTAWASAASAAPGLHGGGGGGGGGGSTTVSTGNDVSYSQCGSTLPSATAFAIVGVNGGLADTPNTCLGPTSELSSSELYWALTTASGTTSQPKAGALRQHRRSGQQAPRHRDRRLAHVGKHPVRNVLDDDDPFERHRHGGGELAGLGVAVRVEHGDPGRRVVHGGGGGNRHHRRGKRTDVTGRLPLTCSGA